MFGEAFRGKCVLITGHTGFKGSWLSIWLERLGARVVGYALEPPTSPSLFALAGLSTRVNHVVGDVRETPRLVQVLRTHRPDFVFHLAAQALVRRSYEAPLDTFAVNGLGTASLLEALRLTRLPVSVVVVTSDKCYEQRPLVEGYREQDPLGGHDPYSASKAAAEIIVASYRRSYFPRCRVADHGVLLATARSGNVFGGGDWATDRIVPDAIRAFMNNQTLEIRNPAAVRPWQHVLEPLSGYLWLAAQLSRPDGGRFAEAWNFGPSNEQAISVRQLADALVNAWGAAGWVTSESQMPLHEAKVLRLGIEKARAELDWRPVWDLATAIDRTMGWYRQILDGSHPDSVLAACLGDIEAFEVSARESGLPWTS